jgi:hypothetical protein
VTAFRNGLMTTGAAFGAGFLVRGLRWWVLYPIAGVGGAGGSLASSIAWGIGAGCLAGTLAGLSAGVAVQTTRPTPWSIALAILVALNSGGGVSRGGFSSVSTYAAAEVAVSGFTAVVAYFSFHGVRGWDLKKAAHANAA